MCQCHSAAHCGTSLDVYHASKLWMNPHVSDCGSECSMPFQISFDRIANLHPSVVSLGIVLIVLALNHMFTLFFGNTTGSCRFWNWSLRFSAFPMRVSPNQVDVSLSSNLFHPSTAKMLPRLSFYLRLACSTSFHADRNYIHLFAFRVFREQPRARPWPVLHQKVAFNLVATPGSALRGQMLFIGGSGQDSFHHNI